MCVFFLGCMTFLNCMLLFQPFVCFHEFLVLDGDEVDVKSDGGEFVQNILQIMTFSSFCYFF